MLSFQQSAIQYEHLKHALKIEQFTSIINVTEHGLARLIERGFEAEEILTLVTKPDFVKIQENGAKAFIKRVAENKYNLIVINPENSKVVTVLRKVDLKAIENLGKNYGWSL